MSWRSTVQAFGFFLSRAMAGLNAGLPRAMEAKSRKIRREKARPTTYFFPEMRPSDGGDADAAGDHDVGMTVGVSHFCRGALTCERISSIPT